MNETPSFFDALGDVLMNAFATVKKADQRFLDMQDYVDKLEDNIITIEKLYSRISQRQTSKPQYDRHTRARNAQ